MVMRKNVMGKNLSQSILRSIGRYLAIVLIIALGSAIFVGLRMTKVDMVETGQVFTDEQNMFDLRLLSSYGWTDEQIEQAEKLSGIADLEASIYQDAIVRLGDSGEDVVFRFYSLPKSVNQVELRGGRMPQAPDECLADGFMFDDSILGTQVTLSEFNEETALEAMACDTYTVVGYVATPLYMDLNRGSTSVGSGSLTSYFYVPAEGFAADYYTEINITIPGDHRVYTDAYNDTLDELAQSLEPQVQQIADSWFADLLADAEAEYADGYQEYQDGLAEFEEGKATAQKELEDAYTQLSDAEAEIAENERLLADGEKQIADGWAALRSGEAELAAGKRELEQARTDTYAQLDAAQAELDANSAQVEDGIAQIEAGLPQLEDGLRQVEDGIAQLEPMLTLLRPLAATGRQMVDSLLALPDGSALLIVSLESLSDMLPGLESLARSGVEQLKASGALRGDCAARADRILALFDKVEAAVDKALEYVTADPSLCRMLLEQIDGAMEELEGMLEEYSAQLDMLYTTRDDLKAQRADLNATLEELKTARIQIADGYAQLKAGRDTADAEFAAAEAELAQGQRELAGAKSTLNQKQRELEDGKRQLEDGKAQLEEGWAEYEEGKLEAEQKIADGEAELADAAAQLAEARQEIDDLEAPQTYVLDRNTNVGYASLDSNSDIVAGVSRVFPVFFLLIAALVCITTMTRMVDEERTQIGTLKALGYSRGAIVSKYLIYAGSGGILGCGLGVILGSVIFPKIIWQAYCIMLYIEPKIQITFDWGLCAAVVSAYTIVVLLTTFYCCFATLREVPAELIRPKAPTSGKKIFLEYLPFWNHISFLNKVALRNIFRYRQRLLMMLIGIGGCTALLVTGFGLRDSISGVADYQFREITQYEMNVYFDGGQSQEDQARFKAAVEGRGEEVMFYHQQSVEIDFSDRVRNVDLIAGGDEIRSFITFADGGKVLPLPDVGEVLLTVGVAEAMGIRPGDTVTLRNADMQELILTVCGIYENYVQNYAVICPETIEAQWGEPPAMQMAFVNAPEGMDLHSLSARITEQPGVMNVAVSQDTANTVGSMMDALDLLVVTIVVCAAWLAVIVLYNLININITERMREIATIKVLGFHSNETASYVFKENMVLAVVGSIAGLGLGWLLLEFVMSQVKIDMVWFRARVSLTSLAISVALTLLSTLIVQLIFTRKLEKINMAEALKSVE